MYLQVQKCTLDHYIITLDCYRRPQHNQGKIRLGHICTHSRDIFHAFCVLFKVHNDEARWQHLPGIKYFRVIEDLFKRCTRDGLLKVHVSCWVLTVGVWNLQSMRYRLQRIWDFLVLQKCCFCICRFRIVPENITLSARPLLEDRRVCKAKDRLVISAPDTHAYCRIKLQAGCLQCFYTSFRFFEK